MDSDEVYDIAVIGGGVVGCSTLFHLTNKGYRCILLEKNKHLVSEASAGNRSLCILLEGIFCYLHVLKSICFICIVVFSSTNVDKGRIKATPGNIEYKEYVKNVGRYRRGY